MERKTTIIIISHQTKIQKVDDKVCLTELN